MEDRRAHQRIDEMEEFIVQHTKDIARLENSVIENTNLTRMIESNTTEIVEIMRGAKGIMYVITIIAKLGIAIAAIYAGWQGFLHYLRGN